MRVLLALFLLASTATAFLTPTAPATTPAVAKTSRPKAARTAPRVAAAFTEDENIPPHVREELEAQAKEAKARIESLIKENQVMLFMKGTKLFPMCGFSNTAVQVLRAVDAEFETFDVLSDPAVRDEIKKFSNWPTIPQCYINGDFVGGSDILLEMFENGELQTMVSKKE